jgi:hypothetical protein
VIALLTLLACNDQGFAEVKFDAIAVVLGDFDHIRQPLDALDIATTPYDGFIVQAVYEPENDRTERGDLPLSVEGLLTDTDDRGRLVLNQYGAVFVASGTRGFGAGQYNNALLPDDTLLADPELLDRMCAYAEGGGSLVVSDWAYEVVEFCWPDAITFFGEDTGAADAAQTGRADVDVAATVRRDTLKESLGEVLSISYDFSAFSVMSGVGPDTEVLLDGTIEHQPAADVGYETLADVPLLVHFAAGGGEVVFANFHWGSQTSYVAQSLLLDAVPGLRIGGGEETEDTSGQEATE